MTEPVITDDYVRELQCAIGEYVMEFSRMETVLTMFLANTLNVDFRKMLFIVSTMGFRARVELAIKAASELLDQDRADSAKQALRQMEKQSSKVRNPLMHQTFVFSKDGLHLARMGASVSSEAFADLKLLKPEALRQEILHINELIGQLLLSPTSDK